MKFYRRIIINRSSYFFEKIAAQYLFILCLFLENIMRSFSIIEQKRNHFSFKIDLLKFEALILAAKNLL